MILPISQTATFNDLFIKLNEVVSSINTTESHIGTLSNLHTLDKTNLVSAINGISGSSPFITNLILED